MNRPLATSLSSVLVLLLAPACFVYYVDFTELRPDETVPDKNLDPSEYIKELFDEAQSNGLPIRDYRPPRIEWIRDANDARRISPESLEEATPLLTFFHVSDVQLRDERAKLFKRRGSKLVDKFIRSAEFHPDQEKYDYASYAWTILTLNKVHADRVNAASNGHSTMSVPQFMIHTGDAVHASTMQELHEFLIITNHLRLPWLNAIGNHDISPFGTFEDKTVYVASGNRLSPLIQGIDIFALMHTGPHASESVIKTIGQRYGREFAFFRSIEDDYFHIASDAFFQTMHGNPSPSVVAGHGLALEEHPASDTLFAGYYAFELVDHRVPGTGRSFENGTPPRFRIVVLNTQDRFAGKLNSHGRVSNQQMSWLRSQIADAASRGQTVLVFGHHPVTKGFLDKDQGDALRDLFRNDAVLAYFTGHTHKHAVHYHCSASGGFGFWEVVTASILEYPNQTSLVTISELPNGRTAIDLQALSVPRDVSVIAAPDSSWHYALKALDAARVDNRKGEPSESQRTVRLLAPVSVD